jgi:ketosteroid isomerase-like protein
MSRENVEIVRELNLAFNRGEAGWIDFYDPDVEYVMPSEWPEDQVYRGREAVGRLSSAMAGTFEGHQWGLDRLIDAGEDCVVALHHAHGSIPGGGEVGQRVGAVIYLRDGKVVRQLTYFSWEEALRAAGVAA